MDPSLLGLLGTSARVPSIEQHAKTLISAAEANIAHIDSQIRDLMCLREQERGLIASLKFVIAPIRRLPTEILADIFLRVVWMKNKWGYPPSGSESVKAALRLSHVSAYWRQLALRTPRMWTMALPLKMTSQSADYIFITKTLLDRSSPFPIPIQIDNFFRDKKNTVSVQLLDTILSIAHRWKSFAVYDFNIFPALARYPRDTMPALEEVSVTLHGAVTALPALQLFLGAPLLREVTLRVPTTRPFSLPWAQLTRVELEESDPDIGLDILARCKNVVKVDVQIPQWEAPPLAPAIAVTTLHHLEQLDLRLQNTGRSGNYMSWAPLFSLLILPALKSLSIRGVEEIGWRAETADACSQFLRRSSNVEDLSLAFCNLSSQQLLSIFHHTPSLSKLTINCCMECLDDFIFEHLTYTPGAAVHLVPRLKELDLDTTNYLFTEEKLEAMLSSRWWSDAAVLATLPAAPPVARWKRVKIFRGDYGDELSSSFEDRLQQMESEGLNIQVE